jgi:hypothetical protein
MKAVVGAVGATGDLAFPYFHYPPAIAGVAGGWLARVAALEAAAPEDATAAAIRDVVSGRVGEIGDFFH